MDLDEYDHSNLVEELFRRADKNEAGVCPYCGRKFDEEECGQPEQHKPSSTLTQLHKTLG